MQKKYCHNIYDLIEGNYKIELILWEEIYNKSINLY